MKVKELIEELRGLNQEGDAMVTIVGRVIVDHNPPPVLGLTRGHYKIDRVTPGAIYPSDVSIRLIE